MEKLNAIEKAFAILEGIVSRPDSGLSFSEIACGHKFPISSTHRILRTLTKTGYISYDKNAKKYRATLKLPNLGARIIESFNLHSHVQPFLEELREKSGHTCHLGILNGKRGIYLLKVESQRYGIKLFSEIGKEFPLHCTAIGKALLAFMDEDKRSQILSEDLEKYTDNTLVDPTALKAELVNISEAGYAVDREEVTRGIVCVAAPVFKFKAEILAAISVTFPAYVAEDRTLDPEIEHVTRCARRITEMLGGES